MSKKISRKAMVAIVAIIAVIAVVGSSLAWYVTQSSKTQKYSISGIDVSADVTFSANGSAVNADKYKDTDGLYQLSLNPEDENYIGKLRVTVNHSGSKCCLRVKTVYEWTLSDGTVSQYTAQIPYTFGEEWFDNRAEDYCVYYKGEDLSGKLSAASAELINGFDEKSFDASAFDEGVAVRALIEVDAVQFNRYPQIWNIEKLPWK